MKELTKSIFLLWFICTSMAVDAQWLGDMNRQGEWYFGWGWNRSHYSASDIHFTGSNYDFTLLDISANDRQSKFDVELYFKPSTITIPQTNMRLGYFLQKNLAISLGVDHMKYVMVNHVTVGFEGTLPNSDYDQLIDDGKILLHPDFLLFEHTDGLNYINTELEYFQSIFNSPKFQFNGFAGAGIGAMLPKSNVTLMGSPKNDQFHLAGYGLDAKLGLEFVFFKYFFIRAEMKKGFINMPDIVTRGNDLNDRASQHFFFTEWDGMFGVTMPIHVKRGGTEN